MKKQKCAKLNLKCKGLATIQTLKSIEYKIMIDQKFKHSTVNLTAKPTRFRIRKDPHKFGSLDSDLELDQSCDKMLDPKHCY
jgi:hypothetical protein